MPFMLLIVEKPEEKRNLSVAEGQSRYDRMMRFADGLRARKVLVAGEALGSDANGLRISKRSGESTRIDGPFAEAKEIVGGFFLLDIKGRDEAVAIAESCPAVEWSTVELREVGPCWDGAK